MIDRRILGLALAAAGFLTVSAREVRALEQPDSYFLTWGVVGESFLDPQLSSTAVNNTDQTIPFRVDYELGGGASMRLAPDSPLSFAPSAKFYFYSAEYTSDGQPVPVDQGFSSAYVFDLLLTAPLDYTYQLGGPFSLTAGVGLNIDARLAVQGNNSDSSTVTPLMNQYFWSEGRFIIPSTSIAGNYRLGDSFSLSLAATVLWPIYNIWANAGYGFFDQTRYMLDLMIRYSPPKATN